MKDILKSIGKFLFGVFELVLIIYVICITTFLLFRNKYGYTEINNTTFVPVKIDTAELIKDGKSGNLLVVQKTSNIKEGDLIYFYIAQDEKYVVKSEYVKSIFNGDGNKLYTLNDDRGSTVASSRVLGKYANQYEGFGTIFGLLTSKYGFLFLVLLPIMILFIYQIYSLVVVLKFEKVNLKELEDAIEEEDKEEKKKKEVKEEKKVEVNEEVKKTEEKPKEEKPKEEKVEETKEEKKDQETEEDIEIL